MARVFLSYDHDDFAFAKPLAAALEKAGHTVWYDRHIHGGAQFTQKIEQALDDADAVLVLWSANSLDSAWVRDEAAEGRDRNKLVPLSIGSVTPPMGFRQYQTIGLGNWKGRGRVPQLDEILDAISGQASRDDREDVSPPRPVRHASPLPRERPRWLIPVAALLLVAIAGFGAWKWFGQSSLPVVAVAAADPSPRSKAAANDLFVKLGSLAQVGGGKWSLVDAATGKGKPDILFRTADTGNDQRPHASVVMLDGKNNSLLWSREFDVDAGQQADLRQQLSFTAGRVLGCALESREAGGLPRDLLKLFLGACAILAESSYEEPSKIREQLRSILKARSRFDPAWRRLLFVDLNTPDLNGVGESRTRAIRELQADMQRARTSNPELPELTLAELQFLPPGAFARRLDLLARAVERSPDDANLLTDQSGQFQAVGRMTDAVAAARRAAEFDPLSATTTRQLVMTLAYAGQMEEARKELARAERLWPGTGALRDALWAFHLRYGDPAVARKYAFFKDEGLDIYLAARANPTPDNIARMNARMAQLEGQPTSQLLSGVIQPLGEFDQVEDVFGWLSRSSNDDVAKISYILFRPSLASVRKDPRFIAVAHRIGLVDYWRRSGEWPDFCNDPELPYDCKTEAAKYAR